jgi:peptidoglycan/xylan/chitin deacetylase (PgdA/CDA1 family)
MRFRIRTLTRPLRRAFSRGRPGAAILTYHRVAAPAADPKGLCVHPDNFAAQMACLHAEYHVLPLSELATRLQAGDLPPRAAAVTFDDGYVDNLEHAAPVLRRLGLPATVFVPSGYVGGEREFWWDTAFRLLFPPERLPETLRLEGTAGPVQWETGRFPERRRLLWAVNDHLRCLPVPARDDALRQLAAQVEPAAAEADPPRAMTAGELVRLLEGGLIEIGGHTVSHPYLPAFPPEAQRAEIAGCKAALEAIVGRPVRAFAYPHGGHNRRTVAIVRETGYHCACTTRSGMARRGADPLRLPRLGVQNWNGERFAQRLRAWWDE